MKFYLHNNTNISKPTCYLVSLAVLNRFVKYIYGKYFSIFSLINQYDIWFYKVSKGEFWPELSEFGLRMSSGPVTSFSRSLIFSTGLPWGSVPDFSHFTDCVMSSPLPEFSVRHDKSLEANLLDFSDWTLLPMVVTGCRIHPVASVLCLFSGWSVIGHCTCLVSGKENTWYSSQINQGMSSLKKIFYQWLH